MLLWILMGIVAAGAAVASLTPLFRKTPQGDTPDGTAIYRDQLRELERDVERGLISGTEAEAARVEISRRLLAASQGGDGAAAGGRMWVVAAGAMVIVAPLAAVGLYAVLGSPTIPDQPLAARQTAPPDQADLPSLIARVEQHLSENPGDGRGWEVIAPAYLRLGQFAEAAEAFANATRILGPTAVREANYGEALVWQNRGLVDDESRAAFERSVALDPDQTRARFYLARAHEQNGEIDEAIAAWRDLLADAPEGAEWVPPARRELARLTGEDEPPLTPRRGPDAEAIAAAAELSPDDRLTMIEGMVASLADRLRDTPGDAEGWARLIRSYVVLDRRDAAEESLADARAALAADADGTALVMATAEGLGLVRQEAGQ